MHAHQIVCKKQTVDPAASSGDILTHSAITVLSNSYKPVVFNLGDSISGRVMKYFQSGRE